MRQHWLWLLTFLLWLLWAVRAHNIMALPVFVDESLHILRAQMVFGFDDATASFLPGKLLLYYYLGLFNPQNVGGAWLARQAVTVLAPLGASLTYRLGVTLFQSRRVGLNAVLLYIFVPYMVFFERLALADTFMMIFALGLLIASVQFARQPTPRYAMLCGLLLGLSILAKLTALPLAMLPPVAVMYLGRPSFSLLMRRMMLIYGVTGLLLLLPLSYVVYQEAAGLEEKQEVVTTTLYVTENQSRLDRFWGNIDFYSDSHYILFTTPLVILFIIGILWRWERGVTILAAYIILLSGFVVIVSARPSTRYFVPTIPASLLVIAFAVESWRRKWSEGIVYKLAMGGTIIAMLTSVVMGLNFTVQAWSDPTQLTMIDRDTFEYFQNAASGYALDEAAADLPELEPLREDGTIPVAGFVAACHTLRLYLPADHDVQLDCPYFKWRVEFAGQTLDEWEANLDRERDWYFLSDDQQPLDLSRFNARWTELAAYERPHNGVTTRLFYVEASGRAQ
ncbi:MAG: glycosyltransferase family 39 protein [Chloroflexi bacterium]|nr:glycosyltransferase family 39 protein [Chloroflexota bacterium]